MPSKKPPKALLGELVRGLLVRPAIPLVLLVLFAPLALAAFATRRTGEDDAEAEGRDYATLPEFPDSLEALASFPKTFEAFFDDQFPLRLPLVKLSAALRFHVFHVSPNPAVVIGQDGWFYDGVGKERVQGKVVRDRNHLADHLGQLRYTDTELAQWARVLEERRVVLAERGTRYVFALAPNKRMIYPEHQPEVLQHLKGETRLEQLERYLPTHTRVPLVKLTDALSAAKGVPNRPLLFYKTDGHWNYYGAFVAYRALVEGVNRAFPGLLGAPLGFEEFELEYDERWSHPRFTAQMGLRVREPFVRLVARPGNPLQKLYFEKKRGFRQVSEKNAGDGALSLGREGIGGILDWPERSSGGTRYRVVEASPDRGVARLFVLGDSFVEKSFYLFAAHAKETYGYREVLAFPDRLMRELAPDVVIHVIVQAFILGEPPQNPDSVSQAYLRILHARAERSLFESDARALLQASKERSSLDVPPLDAPGVSPVVLSVTGVGKTRVSFKADGGKRRYERKPHDDGGQYLELDAEDARRGGKLVFAAPKGELERLSVSIRRIDPAPSGG